MKKIKSNQINTTQLNTNSELYFDLTQIRRSTQEQRTNSTSNQQSIFQQLSMNIS